MKEARSPEIDCGRLFTSKNIGNLVVKNRFIRAATSETMASEKGEVTESLIGLHADLAEGEVGLQILGHAYVHANGQYESWQTGIYDDSLVPGLFKLTDAVHSKGGLIFAQLAFAGSQTKVKMEEAWAPSAILNPISGTLPKEMTEEQIWQVIRSYGEAAVRAKRSGFDGLHIHGANGYLISEFNSPVTNKRNDEWGGEEEKRSRFLLEVYKDVRERAGSDFPVTLKLGVADDVPGGLAIEESVRRATRLENEGLDAIEVSCGIMPKPTSSAQKYVALTSSRAISDLLFHRVFRKRVSESYFLPFARAMKKKLRIPIILVGGLRTTQTIAAIIENGDADFVALARPFIREPDLVRQIRLGKRGLLACTSCNLCLDHEGEIPLTCWRKSKRLLMRALYERDSRSRPVKEQGD